MNFLSGGIYLGHFISEVEGTESIFRGTAWPASKVKTRQSILIHTMSVADEQSTRTEEKYRPLDIPKNEIRLLSFDTTSEDTSVRLSLQCVSLNDLMPEYIAFCGQNTSNDSSQLSEAWREKVKFTLDTPQREIYEATARFIGGDYICLSYTWGDHKMEKATLFLDGVATAVSKHLEAALRDLRSSFECQLGMKVWADALFINQADIVDLKTRSCV
ncbi:heterokaryon incompatibility protein-domain-containing protein [Penicillium antarcticum]|uniref:heterokaryon incompatibility protein-domain-containing protein n=1 Tax=Penicillium antarcticum TaxID=416450 RepID=UPI00238D6FEB|nr:heterokaryon incompatibility protein-domain-containing protein [Penicillium antarcticum]KAJ5288317.1 heterokaryon incompatibility protein-domain-containing protein [Penicillium antarcticum]